MALSNGCYPKNEHLSGGQSSKYTVSCFGKVTSWKGAYNLSNQKKNHVTMRFYM